MTRRCFNGSSAPSARLRIQNSPRSHRGTEEKASSAKATAGHTGGGSRTGQPMGMRSPVRSHFCLEVEERRFLRFPSNSANSCFTPYAYGGNVRVAPSQETREHSRHLSSVSPCLCGEIPFSVWDATEMESTAKSREKSRNLNILRLGESSSPV